AVVGGRGVDALGHEVTPAMALPTTTRCEVAGVDGQGIRVWAAGDVTGTTFTHASRYQAGVVAANILGQRREADYSAIPRCVFTTPSVFAVGAVQGAAGGPAEDAGTAEDVSQADGAGAAAGAASPDHGPGTTTGNGAGTRRMLRIARVPSDKAEAPALADVVTAGLAACGGPGA